MVSCVVCQPQILHTYDTSYGVLKSNIGDVFSDVIPFDQGRILTSDKQIFRLIAESDYCRFL